MWNQTAHSGNELSRHCLNQGFRPALVAFLESLGLFPLEALFPTLHYASLRFLLPSRFLSVRPAL